MTGPRRIPARDLLTDGQRTTPMWVPRAHRRQQRRRQARAAALLVLAVALFAAGVIYALVIAGSVP